jgi:hypothetical protein
VDDKKQSAKNKAETNQKLQKVIDQLTAIKDKIGTPEYNDWKERLGDFFDSESRSLMDKFQKLKVYLQSMKDFEDGTIANDPRESYNEVDEEETKQDDEDDNHTNLGGYHSPSD